MMQSTPQWHRLLSGGTFGTLLVSGLGYSSNAVLSCHL